ncbi:MAG: polysaccharide deacetylase family protein [Bacteroidetes bacterium]|nr:polysaccharide deacetylase family protein [Bacteroidota bacterium]
MEFIISNLLEDGLGLNIEVTNNLDEFKESNLPRINYSGNDIPDCLNIEPHIILFDYGVKDYSIEVNNNAQFSKIFFKNDNLEIPFDIFGASFWLLTRYEEYLPYKSEQFNRFHYSNSLAYQYDFLHYPLINVWLNELKKILQQLNPDLLFKERKYNFVSTIDIDNVYKYKNKGFVRTMAGYISDLLINNKAGLKSRTSIVFNDTKDPFDCYDFLIATHKELNIKAIYFLLLGDYGMNDKNHSSSDLRFQALIKHLDDYSAVGIHPSFGSNDNLQQLKIEINRLANITHRQIVKSRQHFSMLKFPKTYLALLQGGINEDYSMGYTNINGFRASYCYPFKWYSLVDEHQTNLLIHSFCLTENTLQLEAKKQSVVFLKLALPFINEVKKYQGEFIPIFHNDTFDEKMQKDYIEFLKMANEPPKN